MGQKNCSEKFKGGDNRTVWDTADDLGQGTRRRDMPMMKAYEKDGQLHSLDHRRLAATKIASQRGDIGSKISVDVLNDRKTAQEYKKKNSTTCGGERMRISGTGVEVD